MATDVTRLSFDRARAYRGVVLQQGRVSLEAEANEQRTIDTEEQRAQVIDIVGPTGTPDDGYAVSAGTGFELTIGPGTMYVGGWRVELDEKVGDYHQPDWLDRGRGWRETGREHVALVVQETDVTAVEDPALHEVALGGPDGAGRTRLLQRIVRTETDASTCAGAMAADRRRWLRQGLRHDPETAALLSDSRLLVTWDAEPVPPNPCEPTSTGGYLGAENQLLRVQLTRVGRDGRFDLLWGYDDASFLYRVTPDAGANPVLTLDRSPVDDFHRPRAGQAVQVLRATAQLESTDGKVEGYVAALGGEVGVLTAPYDPDLKTVTFPAPLPADYTDPDETPQLYLRVWEEQITGAEPGQPIALGTTGVQVTITANAGGELHLDDFWCIGVRPSTPTAVYPARLLRTPQPPDGPRQWVAPLAVIEWRGRNELDVLEDCRNPFQPLTELDDSGCCTIEVRPSHAADGTLQARIDRAVAGRRVDERGDRVTVCFAPGRYELQRPLILTERHSNLTLRNGNEAAVLTVREGREEAFGHGMVILADADNVTIAGLEFELPQIPAVLARVSGTTGGVLDREAVRGINAEQANRWVSIGVRTINCAVLAVRDCLFRFTVGPQQTDREDAQTMPRNVFGVGVFSAGGAWGFELTDNRFLHDPTVPLAEEGPFHLLVGYLLTQTALSRSKGSVSLGAARLPGILDDAIIAGNEFRGLSAAVAVAADIGDLRIWDNVVRDCYGGLWLLDAAALVSDDRRLSAAGGIAQLSAPTSDAVLVRLLVLGMVYPLPSFAETPSRGVVSAEGETLAQLRKASAERDRLIADRFEARLGKDDGVTVTMVAGRHTAPSKQLLAAYRGLTELNRLDPRLAARDASVDAPSGSIAVQRNTIDCATADDDGRTGFALLLTTTPTEEGGAAVTATGNRFASRSTFLTAAVSGAGAASVTGNVVVGARGERQIGLAVLATTSAAVTGNVVIGRAVLPARNLPAPFESWNPFNEITL
ncbi:DUF6519 domain-containing protein [Microbacterium sp. BK668]|uniref:DUF6519 domain-containing protein n=1 Tax=Microbacterium sp. BK668 TaxID=2512118 RepID=UPI00105DBBBD|nr:DUF6519 domain-containing protein [Microbacterium sp. BK668]TDN90915.1 hypothetical protein EV279_0408 [Microbacterium sp. BK668]